MHIVEARITAFGEGTQEIERRRGLAIGLQLPARLRCPCLGREVGAVDDVAAIDRQFDAVSLFGRRRAWLGKLTGNTADLYHRACRRIGEHHRHLQKDAEEVADIVGAVLGKAFGAIAALQQESLAARDLGQRSLEIARLAGKDQRRKSGKLRLDVGQRLGVGIIRHLQDRLTAPGIRTPLHRVYEFRHTHLQTVISGRPRDGELGIHIHKRWLWIPAHAAQAVRPE